MSEQTKTHWRKLDNPEYLGAYSILDGGKNAPIIATIKEVKTADVKDQKGKSSKCKIAYLVNQKPLILNATNARMIQNICGTPFIEDWKGAIIEIYATTTTVGRETVDCLRVRPVSNKTAIKPFLEQGSEMYDKLLASAQADAMGKGADFIINHIKNSFQLTEDMEVFLCSEVGTKKA